MKQLHDDAITEDDLEGWLDSTSDFEFEISILKMLTDRRIHALHGGSYLDPLTNRKRQFDIRCQVRPRLEWRTGLFEYRLAIECKNIGANFPLIVQCMPRVASESWHDAIATSEKYFHHLQFWRRESRYPTNVPTGKSLSQVGRDTQKKSFVATDSDVFEKWSQALASAHELAGSNDADVGFKPKFTLVLPIVVVPDDRLWAVAYDNDGNRFDGPSAVNWIPFFVSERVSWSHQGRPIPFTLSHLEFVTKTGLAQLIDLLQCEQGVEIFFSQNVIERYCADHEANTFDEPR